jgi:hypothetical protein
MERTGIEPVTSGLQSKSEPGSADVYAVKPASSRALDGEAYGRAGQAESGQADKFLTRSRSTLYSKRLTAEVKAVGSGRILTCTRTWSIPRGTLTTFASGPRRLGPRRR